jgi:hypothetical protein
MNRGRGWASVAWIAALALAGVTLADPRPAGSAGAEPAGVGASAGAARDERAVEIARRMAAALSSAEQLRVTIDMSYDAVQKDGEALEFGAIRSVALRRPDRAHVEALDRSGAKRLLIYDGKQVAVADRARNVYAVAAYTGDLDGMLAYVHEELRVPVPLAELLSRDLGDLLVEKSDSIYQVDEQVVRGVRCDHLAFRNSETGLQIWVPLEGDPLPRRIVITYEQAPGRPQFRADLVDWDLSPRLSDSLFQFSPDPGAERIYFNTGAAIVRGVPTEEAPQ